MRRWRKRGFDRILRLSVGEALTSGLRRYWHSVLVLVLLLVLLREEGSGILMVAFYSFAPLQECEGVSRGKYGYGRGGCSGVSVRAVPSADPSFHKIGFVNLRWKIVSLYEIPSDFCFP